MGKTVSKLKKKEKCGRGENEQKSGEGVSDVNAPSKSAPEVPFSPSGAGTRETPASSAKAGSNHGKESATKGTEEVKQSAGAGAGGSEKGGKSARGTEQEAKIASSAVSAKASSAGGRSPSAAEGRERSESDLEQSFTEEQLEAFKRYYDKLAGGDGLSKEDFDKALGLNHSIYTDRLFDSFDSDDDGKLQFDEFLQSMAVLCEKGTKEDKLRYQYQLYNPQDDGISKESLREVLETTIRVYGDHIGSVKLSDRQIAKIVDDTFIKFDAKGDGVIDFEEFEAAIGPNETLYSFLALDVPGVMAHLERHQLGKTAVASS